MPVTRRRILQSVAFAASAPALAEPPSIAALQSMRGRVRPIEAVERQARLERARKLMPAAYERGFRGGASVEVGSSSSPPHGSHAAQIVREAQAVIINDGGTVESYNSDISRTFVIGDAGYGPGYKYFTHQLGLAWSGWSRAAIPGGRYLHNAGWHEAVCSAQVHRSNTLFQTDTRKCAGLKQCPNRVHFDVEGNTCSGTHGCFWS